MSKENEDTSLLLGVIPPFLRTPEQVACWYNSGESHTYQLLRKPINLEEIDKYKYSTAIWRENGTLTYFSPCYIDFPDDSQTYLTVSFESRGLTLYTVGRSDDAIAETAAYFMELEETTEESSSFEIRSPGGEFDFGSAQTQCLTRLFEAAPSRHVRFEYLALSAAQSVAVALTPHPTRLRLYGCSFEDGGTAFVDALQERQSTFGSLDFVSSLEFAGTTALNDDNLKRLFQVDKIERLTLPRLKDELALLPFSARADYLDYTITSASLLSADLQSLDIVTAKLSLAIYHDDAVFSTDAVLSFLHRVADLGHFVELKLMFDLNYKGSEIPECIVQELLRAALANSNLKVLDLSHTDLDMTWKPHVGTIFEGLKDHKQHLTFKITETFGPDYSYLRNLLSRNRNITVADRDGRIYSDRSSIDEIYALNRFYQGSAGLLVLPPLERLSLVATALGKRATNTFQRTALLLSNHTDTLWELVQFAKLDELNDEDTPAQSIGSSNRKRRRRTSDLDCRGCF